jgi:TP901 family phage tail tape measure protein
LVNLGSAYGEIQIGTGGAEQNVQGLADKLRNIGGAMSLAITTPLVGIAAAAGMATAEFEQSMNTMQVVSGATAQEMAALQQEALRLGAETSFSAGEAAQGMLELAKAGLSTEQVMAAIGGTLDLAAAGGLSVGQAAEIAANAVNTFGLEAGDTVRVADMLAAAANASSVEVTDMAQGMTMAGAVFAANKVPIEDLSTAIALLGNNGIKGSDAGTSLKTMLMRLTAPTTEAAGVMNRLGIQVYNADGSMRQFEDIVGQLESSTSGLTDEQRNLALTTLFGADAIRAANVLIAEGSTAYAAMKNQVTEAGAAGLVADSKLKGLAGAIEYAKGSIESALITAFLPFTDASANMIRQAADLVTMFTSLPEPVRNAALAFAAVLAAAGPVMLAISGIGAVLGFILSPIGLLVIGVAALAAAWTSDFLGIRTITEQALAPIVGWFNEIITLFTSGTIPIGDVFGELASILFGFNSDTYDTSEAIWSLVSTMTGSEEAATQFTDALWAIGDVTTQTLVGLQGFAEGLQSLGLYMMAVVEDGDYMNDWLTHMPESMQGPVMAIGKLTAEIQEGFGVIVPQVIATVQAAWSQLMALLAPALERLQGAFATAGTQVAGLAPHFEGLLAAVQGFWVAIQPVLEAFGQLFAGVIAVVSVLAVNTLAQAFTSFGTVAGAVIDQITLTLNTFSALITQVVTLVTALLTGDWQTAWSAAQGIVGTFESYFTGTFENLKTIATTVITAITTAVTNTLTDMGVDTEGIMTGISSWWTSIWDGLTEKVQPVIDMVSEFRKALEGFAEWVSGFSIPNPFDGWSMPSMPSMPWDSAPPGQNARGTSYWPGGLSWVGERGPELVDLPRGARVFDAQDSREMGGRTFNITVPVQNLGSQLDMVELAHRVAGVIMQYEGA